MADRPTPHNDALQRFLFPDLACRGELVRLDRTWQEVLARAEYPPTVQRVLGQAFAATALLAATIKFDGSLSLQVRGDAAITLLVTQMRSGGGLRGLARYQREPNGTPDLFGNAQLAITIETGKPPERYQGVVDVSDGDLPLALEGYFARSEQLATRLWLMADTEHCSGMLIQRMPERASHDSDGWDRLCHLTETITRQEITRLGALEILQRLYHQETVQLLDSRELRFACGCSRERSAAMLQGLGREEADSIVAEQGRVSVRCEFCNAEYVFEPRAVEELF